MDRAFALSLRATGIDATKDRVLELCAAPLWRLPGRGAKVFHTLVNPCVQVAPQVLAAYGLQPAAVARAPTFALAMSHLLQYVGAGSARRDPVILVAHNGHRFQWPLLTRELRWARVRIPDRIWLWDTLHLCRRLYPSPLPSMRLYDIAGVLLPEAVVDVMTARQDVDLLQRALPIVAQRIARSEVPLDAARIFAQLAAANEEVIGNANEDDARRFANRQMAVNALTGEDWPVSGSGSGAEGGGPVSSALLAQLQDLELEEAAEMEPDEETLGTMRRMTQLLGRRLERENAGELPVVRMGERDGHEPTETAETFLCEAAIYAWKEEAPARRNDCRRLAELVARLAGEKCDIPSAEGDV